MKEITVKQLEIILKEHCAKYKLKYRCISYDPKCKWIVFAYTLPRLSEFFNDDNECYSMRMDDDYRFISVKRGLTKQLMGVKVLGVETIIKIKENINWG